MPLSDSSEKPAVREKMADAMDRMRLLGEAIRHDPDRDVLAQTVETIVSPAAHRRRPGEVVPLVHVPMGGAAIDLMCFLLRRRVIEVAIAELGTDLDRNPVDRISFERRLAPTLDLRRCSRVVVGQREVGEYRLPVKSDALALLVGQAGPL